MLKDLIKSENKSQEFLNKVEHLVRNKFQEKDFQDMLKVETEIFDKYETEIDNTKQQIEELQKKLKTLKSDVKIKFKDQLDSIYSNFVENLNEEDNSTLSAPSSRTYIIRNIKNIILEEN